MRLIGLVLTLGLVLAPLAAEAQAIPRIGYLTSGRCPTETNIPSFLEGLQPVDLSIERPAHFFTAVNLKTARALVVRVPSTLLVQADQVIESVVGILTPGLCPKSPEAAGTRGFVERLRELGHVEGRNLVVECRRSDGTAQRYRDLATELARLNADAILAVGSAAVRAAKSATTRTPIVAVDLETDPIASGLAASLAKPGGNVTGVFLDLPELSGKRLELLKIMLPGLSRAVLLSDGGLDPTPVRATELAARSLGLELQIARVRDPQEILAAVEAAVKWRARALVVIDSPLFVTHEKRIADLALQRRLPSVSMLPRFVEAGGLMSYGPDVNRLFIPAASTVDRILRGARPGEVPIERPTRFVLAVNVKTANALGLTIPQSILVRADEVIQ